MFDIGFSEIVVIAVVALIVIGPERLPKAARTLGHLFGRLQRYVNDVKADISREMELDELRKLQKQVQGAAQEFKRRSNPRRRTCRRACAASSTQLNATAADAGVAGRAARALARAGAAAGRAGCRQPATPADAEPPRQPSLPGFDKI